MTRHERLPARTATPSSRPAKDLAPFDDGLFQTPCPVTSAAASSPSPASTTTHPPRVDRLPILLCAVPKPATSGNIHSSAPTDRGYVRRGLSGAFVSHRQLSGLRVGGANGQHEAQSRRLVIPLGQKVLAVISPESVPLRWRHLLNRDPCSRQIPTSLHRQWTNATVVCSA
jgi:hypothetical protein